MIRTIEELSINALPALQTMLIDGWVLRFANGYTKRANSINPLYASTGNVHEKIRLREEIYRQRQLAVVFKMTHAVQPENLDTVLADNGFESNSTTSVEIAEIGDVDIHPSPNIDVSNALSEQWFACLCRMNDVSDRNKSTLWQILANVKLPRCFVTVRHDGQPIACGMGVLQGQCIGLFVIVTDTPFRNRGFARQIVRRLLAWGKQNGARRAYLQVMQNNAPALHLYSQIGFIPVYQYWYRIKV